MSAEWRQTSLGELIDLFDHIRVPVSASERAKRKGMYPYYGAQGIIDQIDGFLFDGRYLLVPEDGENLNSRKLPIAFFADGKFWVNNHAHILRGKAGILDDVFLKHWLNNTDIGGYVTGAAQPKLSQANLRRIEIGLPPIHVQRRIASILGAYDELIDVNRQRIALIDEMARRLFEEWFVRLKMPQVDSKDFVNVPLGDVADVEWGDTNTTKSSYVSTGYVAYSASGADGFLDHFDHEGLGIVLSAIGAQCGKMWLADGKWSCIKNTIVLKGRPDKAATRILYLFLSREDILPKRGAAQPFISQGDARKVLVRLPPIAIQKKLDNALAPMLDQCRTLEEVNARLKFSRDMLVPRLISGAVPLSTAGNKLEAVA